MGVNNAERPNPVAPCSPGRLVRRQLTGTPSRRRGLRAVSQRPAGFGDVRGIFEHPAWSAIGAGDLDQVRALAGPPVGPGAVDHARRALGLQPVGELAVDIALRGERTRIALRLS